MMTTKQLSAMLMCTSLTVPCAAFAQTATEIETVVAENESVGFAEDIIVSARLRDERLIDTPVAITAVESQTLSNYSVSRVSDLATLVPSLVVGKAASGSSASIFLRGVGSSSLSAGFDQSVSFVIDGLPMSRGREISLPQFDIERVEVLKGPQALFFGKNTTGGLISVTTKGPTDELEAAVKGGYGFKAEEKYIEAYVSGPITDRLRARLAGRWSDSKGALVNSAAETYPTVIPGQVRTRNSEKRGFSESLSARLTVDWDPTDVLNLELKAGFSKLEDGGPTDLIERVCGGGRTTPFAANGIPPSPNADCRVNGRSDSSALPIQVAQTNYRYAGDGHMYADFNSQYAILKGGIDSDPFAVTSLTGYYRFKQTDLNNVSGEGYPASFSQLAEFKQLSQELRFQSKFGGPLNVQFGVFYAHGDFTFNTDAYIFPVPLDTLNDTFVTFKRDNGFKSDSLSMFAEAVYEVTDTIELSGGARYSMEARDSYQRSLPAHIAFAAAFPGDISLTDRFRDTNISPEATVRYKPSTDVTIYAAYKQGFKSGGFNISQALTPAASVDAGRYRSETAEGAEIGLRTQLLDRRLSLNATAYSYTYSDLQVQFFDPQSVSLIAGNAGKLKTQGVEADFNFRVLDGFSLRGAAAYNDASYRDFVGQCYPGQTIAAGCSLQFVNGAFSAQDYDGRTPPKAPKFAGRAGFTFDTPVGSSGWSLMATSDVSYTSSYNYTDALRPDSVQSAYAKLDAAISVRGPDDRWTISLIGRNLTNALVVTTANDIPFAGGTGTGTTGPGVLADMSVFVDNPREVFLELGLKF